MGPGDLSALIAPLLEETTPSENVLVGPGTSDDAGVYRYGDAALVATADFITPVCDDPHRFGRVAAANALSDVYAMGGRPLFALNLCCFPTDSAPRSIFAEILAGGLDKLRESGTALLGGHSVRDAELKFGLAVVGRADPGKLLTNTGARPGDRLLLTKPLGTGAIINGFRGGQLSQEDLEPALREMEKLNDVASELALAHGATACTDVTGFGLAGHALELARGAGVSVRLHVRQLPVHDAFDRACAHGVSTRGTRDNAAAANEISGIRTMSSRDRQLLFDPQTSGGLLITVPEKPARTLLADLRARGHHAAIVGEVLEGPARLRIA